MTAETLTFEIGGTVMVDQLATGVSLFHRLVSALTADTGVQWVVEDLQSGSAVVTLEGHSETPHEVERVVLSYADVGRALEDQEYLTYQPPVKRVAEQIRSFAETVEAVRFQTAEADYTVITGKNSKISPKLTVSIGSVTGRIQTVSNRGRLRFNLYDSTFDRAVGCYLQNGQEELVREVWGRRASVSGRVTRESDTGRALAVRDILEVEILKDIAPGSYRLARGAVSLEPGSESALEVIRRLRDA
jgi:hypothetical protein